MHYKIEPWAHQLRAIEAAKDLPQYALFFEQGTGKTATLINILRHKFDHHRHIMPTLILCPQIVTENWKRELLANSDIGAGDICILRGELSKRLDLMDCEVLPGDPKIVITNYESLYMNKLFAKLEKWAPSIVVLDESQKIKNHTTKRTKQCLKLGQQATYRYILSGTPIINSQFDIFSQFLFLDKGETFDADYKKFRTKYFVDYNAGRPPQSYFPDWRPRMGTEKRIHEWIYKKYAMRVVKEECLDLPPYIRQRVEIELDGEQKKAYDSIYQDALWKGVNGIVSADMALKIGLRLQQITSGFVKLDTGYIKSWVPNPRLNALEETLDAIAAHHKVIIWAVFKQNYQDIAGLLRQMGVEYVEAHGEISEAKKRENIDAFNDEASGVRALIGHPASCGVGANLTAAPYAIFYSRDFSLENDLQAEARNYRGGSEVHDKVTRIDIVARETIDEKVLEALSNKQAISDAIVNYVGKKDANIPIVRVKNQGLRKGYK